ncbi:hypothetical protein L484_002584 [Morus notabilis]|uniref:Uncharacterized protein n=1 Tax=Morus notabilis TaxID=981085 RepID=W9RZF2_9ROSA|nr:hypothetical protein L484_002584 [Morus notabilis]
MRNFSRRSAAALSFQRCGAIVSNAWALQRCNGSLSAAHSAQCTNSTGFRRRGTTNWRQSATSSVQIVDSV